VVKDECVETVTGRVDGMEAIGCGSVVWDPNPAIWETIAATGWGSRIVVVVEI
jgi:hypothetical protein